MADWRGHTDYPHLELSVVILSAGKDLDMAERCVRSALVACKEISPSCEVIFLDNASSSGVGLAIASLYPRVIVLRFPERVGFCTGNNAGFLISKGKLIVQLNDDTEVDREAFVELREFFRDHPDAGAVGPRLETMEGRLQTGYYARKLPKIIDTAFHLFGINGMFPNNPVASRYFLKGEDDRTRPVEQPAGAALTYRRSALFEIGLLDQDYTFGFDDVDVCRRMLDAHWEIHYLREARVRHRGGVSLPNGGPRISRHTLNGTLCYWRKHGSRSEAATVQCMMLCALLLRIPVEIAANATRPKSWTNIAIEYGNGWIDVLRSLFGKWRPERLSACSPIEIGPEVVWGERHG